MALFGTIILADYVTEATENKFVIAGTYNTLRRMFQGESPTEDHRQGLQMYVRFNPERVGLHKVVISIKDQHRQVFDESLAKFNLDFNVMAVNTAVEVAIKTPDLIFVAKSARKLDDSHWRYDSTIELHVDGELIGSAPLWVLYARQP